MTNQKKAIKLISIVCIIITVFILLCSVYAAPSDPGYTKPTNQNLTNKIDSIWATVADIVQIICVACIVFAGLRYMFASSDTKATIKKGLIYLVTGAVLVFGAVFIMSIIDTAAEKIL